MKPEVSSDSAVAHVKLSLMPSLSKLVFPFTFSTASIIDVVISNRYESVQ